MDDAPELTIRDLLTHSACFPQDDPWADRNLDITDEDLILLLKKGISFSNVPGITYEYSNLTFGILGYIIKKISGITYQEFIIDHIWKPLNMTQAAWEFLNVPGEQLAQGYKYMNGQWEEEEMLHDGSFASTGGMITSIESFSRYVALHQSAWRPRNDPETSPIKIASIREMHQPWRFGEFDTQTKMISAYGYELRWLRDENANIYIGHGGGLPGFGSNWFIMPDYGLGVIVFANVTYAAIREINLEVLDTIIKKAQLTPRPLLPSDILIKRQKQLIQFLPDWKEAQTSGIFAKNFFLDLSIDLLKEEATKLFAKMRKIIHISEVVPENQLRGYFIIEGEKAKLKVSFTLTPENPALIQHYQIEEKH